MMQNLTINFQNIKSKEPKYLFIQVANKIFSIVVKLNNLWKKIISKVKLKFVEIISESFLINFSFVVRLINIISIPVNTRRYINTEIGREGFFDVLKERGVRYVVLRWFEGLPDWPTGEDIDLLIHDEDLDKINDLFVNFPKTLPCDIYSVSPLIGSSYSLVGSYYPPDIAQTIIDNRILFKDKYYIPKSLDHFFSLAYHALYHKGIKSGIPLSKEVSNDYDMPDHNYSIFLEDLAHKNQISTTITLKDLHDLLTRSGWNPSIDTLRKLSVKNQLPSDICEESNTRKLDGELIVFVIREWAIQNDLLNDILNWLERYGLDIIHVKKLDEKEQKLATSKIRGGNWGKGPYPISGGNPRVIVAAYDYHPISVPEYKKDRYPFVSNGHIFLKDRLRLEINKQRLKNQWTNCIHSSDDEIEAWEYLEITSPECLAKINKDIIDRKKKYLTSDKVIKLIDSGRTRSKIELIEYKDGLAIKKTFKPGRERFLEREKFVYRNFSKKLSAIPHLLEEGDNYCIIPYYENILLNKNKVEKQLILKEFSQEIVNILSFFYHEGFAIVGFYPGNLIVTPDHQIKIVDFEFLYNYKNKPNSFLNSYDLAGMPKKFDGDLPLGYYYPGHTYNNTWKSIIMKKHISSIV